MSNSPLVTYTNISPNKSSPRNHVIDTITIHCVVGQLTAKQIVNIDKFRDPAAKSSCNYAVGTDGSIGLCVEEKDRAWTSSSRDNDNRAITIEVASDMKHPYAVNDTAMAALIELVTDICKRNGIKELKWKADKSLIGQVDKQNMTAHRWFAATSCPGDYLYEKFDDIAAAVNAKLNSTESKPTINNEELYRVRKSWTDSASQIGAYSILENAKIACDKAGNGYEVYNSKGIAVYPEVKKTDPILRKGSTGSDVKTLQTLLTNLGFTCEIDGNFGPDTQKKVLAFQKDRGLEQDGIVGPKTWAALKAFTPYKVKVTASILNVRSGPSTTNKITTQIKKNEVYTIVNEKSGWGKLKSGAGWISLNYT